MSHLFKVKKLGAFLAHGRQYRRMGLVYIVTSSQCVIHTLNKHKEREKEKEKDSFLFYRMPDSSIVFGCNDKSDS